MTSKFKIGAVLILPVAIALSGCGRDEPATTAAPSTPAMETPPAVESRMDQAGAVIDDASITAKVKTALIAESDLSGFAIDVDTSANVVTLNGTVDSDAKRERAETVAKGVEGVKEVKNNLIVKAS